MYNKKVWIDNVSIADAESLNNIENGIENNSNNINNISSNTYFIGRYTNNLNLDISKSQEYILNPDKIISKGIDFENGTLTINEDGLYYINAYIHIDNGCRRSFIDVSIENGGELAPTVIRSQDTQNMFYDENSPTGGDPTYELNRPVFLKAGCKIQFKLWIVNDNTIMGGEKFDAASSNISVIKISNYPSEEL